MMPTLPACPKCGGYQLAEQDWHGLWIWCLMCGRAGYADAEIVRATQAHPEYQRTRAVRSDASR